MPIRSFEGTEPELHPDAYVDETAVVVGDVTLEADVSVWPNTVLRGDHGGIRLQEGSNVQDGTVCHEGAEIGPYATVGHNAIVHGATVGPRALVGMGAVVLDDSTLGEEAMVGANSLVTEGTEVPANTLAAGTPAQVLKEVEDSPWARAGDVYVDLSGRHGATSETLYERWPPRE
jgi:carbonic anhydrase/acetyltransferase-like protein (isoleucine patch superfamily)